MLYLWSTKSSIACSLHVIGNKVCLEISYTKEKKLLFARKEYLITFFFSYLHVLITVQY